MTGCQTAASLNCHAPLGVDAGWLWISPSLSACGATITVSTFRESRSSTRDGQQLALGERDAGETRALRVDGVRVGDHAHALRRERVDQPPVGGDLDEYAAIVGRQRLVKARVRADHQVAARDLDGVDRVRGRRSRRPEQRAPAAGQARVEGAVGPKRATMTRVFAPGPVPNVALPTAGIRPSGWSSSLIEPPARRGAAVRVERGQHAPVRAEGEIERPSGICAGDRRCGGERERGDSRTRLPISSCASCHARSRTRYTI